MCKKMPIRGALIVLEGCDRSGKTTQCKQLGKMSTEKEFRFYFQVFIDALAIYA